MKTTILPAVIVLVALLTASHSVFAGEPLEALAGEWVKVSQDGKPLDPKQDMRMIHESDTEVHHIIKIDGKQALNVVVRYKATADGKYTMYKDENDKVGITMLWKIQDDGTLIIYKSEEEKDKAMIMRRPA